MEDWPSSKRLSWQHSRQIRTTKPVHLKRMKVCSSKLISLTLIGTEQLSINPIRVCGHISSNKQKSQTLLREKRRIDTWANFSAERRSLKTAGLPEFQANRRSSLASFHRQCLFSNKNSLHRQTSYKKTTSFECSIFIDNLLAILTSWTGSKTGFPWVNSTRLFSFLAILWK